MKWMKFTNTEGYTIYCNMAKAISIYANGNGSHLDFGDGQLTSVTETPEEIIARGEWVVK